MSQHGASQPLAPEDAAFFKIFTSLLVALTVLGVVVFFLAQFVGTDDSSKSPERINAAMRRTEPAGKVSLKGEEEVKLAAATAATEAEAPPALDNGEAVYNAVCSACHANGIAGAPKTGDKAAWEPRAAQGWETLAGHAIQGYQGKNGLMPAKGGRADLTDAQVQMAIGHILTGSELAAAVPAEYAAGAAAAPAEAPAPEAPAPEAAPATATPTIEATEATTPAAPAAEPMPVAEAAAPEASPAEAPAGTESAPPEAGADAAGAVSEATLAEGKATYDSACFVCHTAGVAGAPKLGSAEDWEARVAQGRETLYSHAINGYMGSKGMMPPKGGRGDLSDDQVKAAIEYMLSQIGK